MEGTYYCSNMMMSNALELVAYPEPNFTLPSSYVFETAHMATGTINRHIMPGKLRQYYSVTWNNDNLVLVSSAEPMQLKYRPDDNFSLTINNIELSDNSKNYRCSVTIDDPQIPGSVLDKVYDQRQLGLIMVMVYAGDFDLMVTITIDGNVQLMVTPIEDYLIPELTRLRISFTSEDEERNGVIRNVTSIAAFMNAEILSYWVPFQRFRVQVAQLVEGTTGPLVPSDLDSAPINGEFLNIMMCRLCSLHVWSRCVLAVARGC